MKNAILFGAALLALVVPTAAMAQYTTNTVIQQGDGYGDGYGNGGRGGGGQRDRGNAVNWRNNQLGLDTWLYTDRVQYQSGTGVLLRLTATNLLNKQSTFTLQPRGEYEIAIRDMRTNRIVWARNRVANRNGSLQFGPGGTAQWNEIWDQRDSAGKAVPMGTYQIEASILGLPLKTQIFLADRSSTRPDPGTGGGNGGIIAPDPVTGPANPGPVSPYPGNPGNGTTQPPIQAYQTLRGAISLSSPTAQPGSAMRFTYTVVNTGRSAVTLNFRSSQMFDAWATPVTRTPAATRTAVWRFSEGMVWGQMMQSVTLEPGQSRIFTGTWRVPAQLTAGQSLDVSAAMTPANLPSGAVGAASARLQIN